MRTGKVSEAVLKRSVLRQLNKGSSAAESRYGADCGILCRDGGPSSACAVSGPLPGFECDPGKQVTAVVNNLACVGAQPEALMIQAVVPVSYEEADLREDMKRLGEAAGSYQMKILGGHTEVSAFTEIPQYFVTGLGSVDDRLSTDPGKDRQDSDKVNGADSGNTSRTGGGDSRKVQAMLRPGQELILTKWIGLGGTAALAARYEEELGKRYPFSIIDQAKAFENLMSVAEEARAMNHFGACAMHDLSQGGIFGGLWEMAERAGVGLEVDLKKIPVKQETIEICEYFDINPYYLYSAGALLAGTDQAEAVISGLYGLGIPATVIGRVTKGHDRIIRNGEDVRFLDRPAQDEWYRLQEIRMSL